MDEDQMDINDNDQHDMMEGFSWGDIDEDDTLGAWIEHAQDAIYGVDD